MEEEVVGDSFKMKKNRKIEIESLLRMKTDSLRLEVKKNRYDAIMVLANRLAANGKTKNDFLEAAELFERSMSPEFEKENNRPLGETLFNEGCAYHKAGYFDLAVNYYTQAGKNGYISGFFRAGSLLEIEQKKISEAIDIYKLGISFKSISCEGRYVYLVFLRSRNPFKILYGLFKKCIYIYKFQSIYRKSKKDQRIRY